jgi:hypothetical protein
MTTLLRPRPVADDREADMACPDDCTESSATPPRTFLSLPPEIHLMVSRQLIYPDALSLKHTSRYFYGLVDTGVELKIDWLVERRRLHLECPNSQRCDLGSDLRFCRGSVRYVYQPCFFHLNDCMLTMSSVIRLLMQRRREHIECESRPGLGCLVYGTSTCTHARKFATRLKRWMRLQFTIEIWWLLLSLLPVVLGWLWIAGFLPLL